MSDSVPAGQQGYPTWMVPSSETSEQSAQQFQIEQMIAKIRTAQLVSVQKVSTKGEVGPVGNVGVTPLVKMVDGQGNTFPHGQIHSLPFYRLQGGADKAIIMDPKVDDIGLAIFADRDISGVKKNKKASPPGSYRTHDMADGLYLGSFLSNKPKCYIQFTDDNKIISSPDEGTTQSILEKNKITLQIGAGTTVVIEPTKITLTVGAITITMTGSRVDLGGLGGAGVVTAAGTSTKVFAIL